MKRIIHVIIVVFFTSINLLHAAAGDDCSTAILVSATGCSTAAQYNNTGITGTLAPPTCFGGGTNNGMWFKFVASGPVVTTTVTGASLTTPMVGLFSSTGACVSPFTELGCSNPGTATATLTYSALTTGTTYYIYVDGANNAVGTFQLCLSSPSQPSNDSPCNAITLPTSNFCSGTNAYTTVGATGENLTSTSLPACFDNPGVMNSVYFAFTATGTTVSIHLNGGSLIRPQIALLSLTGACTGTSYSVLGCSQAASGSNTTLTIANAIPGTAYLILVDGFSSNVGSFEICLDNFNPVGTVANDDCSNATILCPNNHYYATTNGATPNATIDPHVCTDFFCTNGEWQCNGVIDNSVWFTFTTTNPVSPINFTINSNCIDKSGGAGTYPDGGQLQFEVFKRIDGLASCANHSASNTGSWSSKGCSTFGQPSPASGTLIIPAASLVANTQYFIVVDNYPGCACDFDFTITGNQGTNAGVDQTVCLNAAAFNMTGFSAAGGTWSGPGITNTALGTFNPAIAGIGTHQLFYTVGPCTDTKLVTVTGPTVNISNNVTICPNTCTTLLGDATQPQTSIAPASFTNTTDFPIPDGTGVGISSPITTSGLGTATIATVTLNITHTWDSDLSIVLQCPNGTQLSLSSSNGGSSNNYTNTVFSSTAVVNIISGAAPFTGNFIPQGGVLTSLNTCGMNGTWQLLVTDNAGGDVGTLLDWSISFNNSVINTIPATSFTWSPTTAMTGAATLSPTVCPTATTTYTLTGTDVNGCIATHSVTVTTNPFTVSATPTASICTGGSATLTATGATTYSWSPAAGLSATTGATVTASPTVTTTYTVTGTTAGCTDTATSIVTFGGLTVGVNSPSYCPGGSATLTATGGTTYSWSPAAGLSATTGTSVTATPTITTVYTVTGTTGACSGTVNSTVTVYPVPVASIAAPAQLTCATTSIVLNGGASSTGANFTYNWTTAGGTIVSGGTTNSATINAIGTYTLTVTNTVTTCTTSASVTVTTNTVQPNANAGAPQSLSCAVTTVVLNGSSSTAGATFSWAGPGIVSGGTTASPTVNAIGTYTLTVTDPANGCTNTSTVVVSMNNTPPVANAGTPQTLTCTTTTVTLDGSASPAAMNYAWTGPTAGTPAGTTPIAITTDVTTAGTYTITVTDPANGCTNTSTVVVNSNTTLPTANAGTPQNLSCATTTVTLNGSASSAAMNYAWTGPTAGTPAGTTPSATLTDVAAAGTYTLTVTDPINGCVKTATVIVNLLAAPPVANAGTSQTITCLVSSVVLGGASTTGMNYSWTGPTAGTPAGTTPAAITTSVNAVGTYTLTVTDAANGCTSSNTVVVSINTTQPNANAGTPQTLTCSIPSVALSGSSTTIGATYVWTGTGIVSGGNTATPTINAAGTYTLTVTDPANGCTNTANVVISSNTAQPLATAGSNTPCVNTTLNLTAANSVAGATYSWVGPNTFVSIVQNPTIPSVTAVVQGVYTLTVTDPSNGCTSTSTVNAVVNPLPVIAVNAPSVCVNQTISLTANGGTTFSWTGPNSFSSAVQNPTIPNATVAMNGTYSVTVTDANLCVNTSTGIVTVNTLPVPIVANSGPVCVNTVVNLSSAGGATYAWSGPNGFSSASQTPSIANATIAATGTYTVVVTDIHNCQATTTTTVVINPAPIVTLSPQISGCVPICGDFGITSIPLSTTVSFSMGDGNVLSGNDTVYGYCYKTPGIYGITVTASDANGCKSITPFNGWVNAFNLPTAIFSASPQPTTIFDPEINFTNQSSGGPISASSWTFGDSLLSTSSIFSPTFTYVYPGTYNVQLIVTNTKGCIDTVVNKVVIDDDFAVYLPSAFSPNGDHINETFYPKGNGIDESKYQFWIFDRWGNLIFYTEDYNTHWNGKVQGKGDLVQEDVYVWKLKVQNLKGDAKHLVGHVTVVR